MRDRHPNFHEGRDNLALETENTLLATEPDILRQAAKYFAGETRW